MADSLALAFRRAQEVLRGRFGHPAFRPMQRRAVLSALAGRDVLAVLPTGGGKSVCFQVPALVSGGLTVVVSPLIALMQDQVAAATARGIPSACLHSAQDRAAREAVWDAIRSEGLRLLYLAPERLLQTADALVQAGIRPTRLVVDEAHCITEWGHDFRPAYRTLRRARHRLGWPPTLALTGSATPDVRADLVQALGLGTRGRRCDRHLASFDRRNLWLGVIRVPDEPSRLRELVRLVRSDDHVALVYAPTRAAAEALARALGRAGVRAAAYHAGLSAERRRAVLDAFLTDAVETVVATCAFGMGIDKPTVRLVVHWTLPATPEAYYQEAGRAGRDGGPARCVALHGAGDDRLHRRQLATTFPAPHRLHRLWRDPSARVGVPAGVLASAERLRRELRPERGPVDWRPVRRRRRMALARLRAMERYATGGGCRRVALLGWFGETVASCAGCDRCRLGPRSRLLRPDAERRLASLVRALGRDGGGALDGPTLHRIAVLAPASEDALAGVPGVGPWLARALGGKVLGALASGGHVQGPEPVEGPSVWLARLRAWRTARARAMGVPDYLILPETALHELAARAPWTAEAFAGWSGLGPQGRAAFGAELLGLVAPSGESAAGGLSMKEDPCQPAEPRPCGPRCR